MLASTVIASGRIENGAHAWVPDVQALAWLVSAGVAQLFTDSRDGGEIGWLVLRLVLRSLTVVSTCPPLALNGMSAPPASTNR